MIEFSEFFDFPSDNCFQLKWPFVTGKFICGRKEALTKGVIKTSEKNPYRLLELL
jgi:hypothetical protein